MDKNSGIELKELTNLLKNLIIQSTDAKGIIKYLIYPLYVISTIKKTTIGSSTLQIIKDIYSSNGIVGLYRGGLTLLVLSPAYFSAKYLTNKIGNKLFSKIKNNKKDNSKNDNTNNNEESSSIKRIFNFFSGIVYKYPKMLINQCVILSPLSYSCFNIVKDVVLRDNIDLGYKQAFNILLKFIPSVPFLLARRVFQHFFKNESKIGGFSFKNLFYGVAAVVPVLVSKRLIRIGLNKLNEKVLSSPNVNDKFKDIYCNGTTQTILYTILTNPLDVISLQYINQFVNSYVSIGTIDQLDKAKGGKKLLSIVPAVINPIQMAIKIFNQHGGLLSFFRGIIPLTIFNLSKFDH